MKVGMKTVRVLVLAFAAALVGCTTTRPEAMEQTERDRMTYEDKGVISRGDDSRFRISVCMDQKEAEKHPKVEHALESQLAEIVGKFKFFEFVEQSRIDSLSAQKLLQGQQMDVSALAADCLLSVKLNVSVSDIIVKVDAFGKVSDFGRPQEKWRVSLKPDFRLYDVSSGKVALMKSYTSDVVVDKYGDINAMKALIESAVVDGMREHMQSFSMLMTSKYTPPARVLETRGDGKVAMISIGLDYGLVPGMRVEFFRYVDNSDIVAGGERTTSSVGSGLVLEGVGPKSAFVEIEDASTVQVMRGHYVRIPEVQNKAPEKKSWVDRFLVTKLIKDILKIFVVE